MYVNVRAMIERVVNGELQLYLQIRDKPNQPKAWELPGGQLEEYESMIDGLKREVREETGLELTRIAGKDTYLQVRTNTGLLEGIQPFAVYQTLEGPIDSMGVYFRCEAKGTALQSGDQARDGRWIPVKELKQMAEQDSESFSWIDSVGIQLYLQSEDVKPVQQLEKGDLR
ncbi:NUDIX hydrolase [Paenibacillus amylolyticus]|uniref:NUDIX hydrolase n=1 Tax=Paenibacillus amylolyticus TaxID=1451 RepID=UPI00201D42E9|nr:NUDIX domain-containing protein [Paenibacillus amylolyticus]MCL6661638.1 NUDIX domain-containing protein [Paenibacillus amylolyticus]